MKNTINEINVISNRFTFLEFSILSYTKNKLVIAGSADFFYYHNFEIHFEDVFSIIGNVEWEANTQKNVIEILHLTTEAYELNKKYEVEQGYNIFKFNVEGNFNTYIIAKNILFKNELVNY